MFQIGDLVKKSNNVPNIFGIGLLIENCPLYVVYWLESGITTKYFTPADLERYVQDW